MIAAAARLAGATPGTGASPRGEQQRSEGGECCAQQREHKGADPAGGPAQATQQHHGQPGPAAVRGIPHSQQHLMWDCGVACVLMAMQALGCGGGASYESLVDACGTSRCAH